MTRSPAALTRRTFASRAITTGARSEDEMAQHFEPPGATQHTSPSFFMQKLIDFRHQYGML